jgi:periplasmic divalent cation tolerance protein
MMIVVFSTAPDRKVAKRIAETLVLKKVAACVSILKIEESVYRWKGNVERVPEYLLIIKAKKGNFEKIEKEIKKIHPYSVPELVGIKAEKVSKKYKEWVLAESSG